MEGGRRTRRRYFHARPVGCRASRPYRPARRKRDTRLPRELSRGGPRPGECLHALRIIACPSDKGPDRIHGFKTIHNMDKSELRLTVWISSQMSNTLCCEHSSRTWRR